MQPARATWTDERLDDLSGRVDRGFAELRTDIGDLRTEIKSGDEKLRAEMGVRFGEMNTRFGQMDTRIGRLERTVNWFGTGIIATLVAALLEGRL